MMWETTAEDLIMDDGEVRGVVVQDRHGQREEIRSKKVMLACGGFEGNKDMLAEYVRPKAADLELIAPVCIASAKWSSYAGAVRSRVPT